MTPDFLDAVLEAAWLALLFFTALFLPVILQLLLLFATGWLYERVAYRASYPIATALGLIGVPLHELFHALGALLTLCGVNAVKLFVEGVLYAFVQVKRTNFIGRIVVGLAPLLGGVLVLWLTSGYVIPGFEVPTIEPPQLDLESAASFGTVFRESVHYLGRFVQTAYEHLFDLQWDNWRTYAGLYIAFSVGIAMAPSDADIRFFRAALPVASFLTLGFFTLLYLDGNVEGRFTTWQQALWPHVLKFSTAVTYAFVLTSLGILVFLPLRLFRAIRQEEG